MRMAYALLLMFMLPLSSASLPAQDQNKNSGIHRCTDANGQSIFTDAACTDIGASDKPPPKEEAGNLAQGFKPIIMRACASTPDDLQWGIQNSIEQNDVNHLASFYDWTGFSSTEAEKVMDRLEVVAKQSLLSVEFVYPQIRRRIDTEVLPARDADELLPTENIEPEFETYYGDNPVGVAIYQYADKKNQRASSTHFRVFQHKRCWWIRY
jgi:hypothetical protein